MHPDTVVSVNVTNRCNLNCSHCGNHSSSNNTGILKPQSELCRVELAEIFSMLAKKNIRYIGIAGGEPLVRDDFVEIMKDLHEYGLRCMLFSNGLLLNNDMIRQIITVGSVDVVRMSIEFPERVLRHGKKQMFHPTEKTLDAISRCADAGLPVGVNMTLLPDNIEYVEEVAESAKQAGASFLRAVPVLPIGSAAHGKLPENFTAVCLEAVLNMHSLYTPSLPGAKRTDSINRVRNSFAISCGAGSSLFSIDADGTLTGCPLFVAGGRKILWNEYPLAESLKRIREKTTRLQKKITRDSAGRCSECDYRINCRGGCIAEWDSRGRPSGQSVCYASELTALMRKKEVQPKVKNMLYGLLEKMNDAEMFGVTYSCMRSLPLWTVWFN